MSDIHQQTAAEDDLVAIWQYSFETWGGEQADRYLDGLNEGIARLAENAELGVDCSHLREGYRRLQVCHHCVFCRVCALRIEIVRVLHERMNPDRHLIPPGAHS